jgi:hypothetical protein
MMVVRKERGGGKKEKRKEGKREDGKKEKRKGLKLNNKIVNYCKNLTKNQKNNNIIFTM